jgi:ADP-ribose pyrophosphatase YjhB (NUDIX family)
VYRICTHPITSFGIICFRWTYDAASSSLKPQYLMVRRKDSLCYVEFIRGKYALQNQPYIVKLFENMTPDERERIRTCDFDSLWYSFWQADCNKNYMKEYHCAKDKFEHLRCSTMAMAIALSSNCYLSISISVIDGDRVKLAFEYGVGSQSAECRDVRGDDDDDDDDDDDEHNVHGHVDQAFDLHYLLAQTHVRYKEAEWGFPKGRRNINETDVKCALREFKEESGYDSHAITILPDVTPLEEVFTGCNKVRYRHVYFVAQFDGGTPDGGTIEYSPSEVHAVTDKAQGREISQTGWLAFETAFHKIREQNTERRELFEQVHARVLAMQPPANSNSQ